MTSGDYIVIAICLVAFTIIISPFIAALGRHMGAKAARSEATTTMERIQRLKYTQSFLEYLKQLTVETSYLSYREMMSTVKNLEKTNMRTLTKEWIEKSATAVYEALDPDVLFESLIVSKDYIDNYIINVTKTSFQKLIKDMEETYIGQDI
jgi:hypothetical protein